MSNVKCYLCGQEVDEFTARHCRAMPECPAANEFRGRAFRAEQAAREKMAVESPKIEVGFVEQPMPTIDATTDLNSAGVDSSVISGGGSSAGAGASGDVGGSE